MAQGEIQLRVNRPPAEVFPFVGDLEKAPQWVPDLVSVTKVTEGGVRVGTRYDEVVKMGKSTAPAELEVTEYEPDRLFAHTGEGGPSRFTGRFLLEPDGEGTLITHSYSVKMTGLYKLLSPFVNSWVRKNGRAGMQNLKRIIESR